MEVEVTESRVGALKLNGDLQIMKETSFDGSLLPLKFNAYSVNV
jgi:hypothetical protein